MATEHRKTYRERNEKAIAAIDRRAELLGLVEAYRGLKRAPRADGLLRPDRAGRPARARRARRSARSSAAKFKVVLLDEYQDTSVAQALMLSRLFSGPDAEHGLGHPVTAVGDPNQAIYGWRGASVSNILEFAGDFPAATAAPRRTPSPSTGAPTSGSSPPPTTSPPSCTTGRPELLPLEAKPGAAAARYARSCTRPTTTSWPGWPTG